MNVVVVVVCVCVCRGGEIKHVTCFRMHRDDIGMENVNFLRIKEVVGIKLKPVV